MDRMKRERERLLQRTARVYGLSFTAVAAACILLPGEVPVPAAAGTVALLAVLAVAQWRIGTDARVRWMVVVLVTGIAAMVVAQLGGRSASSLTALTHLSVGSVGSLALLETIRPGRLRVVAAAFVLTSVVAVGASWDTAGFPYVVLVHVFGWMLAGILGYWLSVAVHRVGRRITDIGRAHRAERMASELEAQRRQGASSCTTPCWRRSPSSRTPGSASRRRQCASRRPTTPASSASSAWARTPPPRHRAATPSSPWSSRCSATRWSRSSSASAGWASR